MSEANASEWRVTGATVRGAIHTRRGTPNQDAIAWDVPRDDVHAPRLLAVADGHGAPLHFRSHRGSRLAVRAAITVLRKFAREVAGESTPVVEERAHIGLPRELVQFWRSEISTDIAKRPLALWELDTFADRVSPASLTRLEYDPAVAYGSTLIAAMLAPEYALYVQLGDGDIVEVNAGEPTSPALPTDPLLLGNETTSLCSPDAWSHVRVAVQSRTPNDPHFVMLSTDGYANSFEDAAGLSQAASDLCTLSSEMGMLELARSLPGWLRETSTQGSGDDITVGLAVQSA